MSYFPEIAWGAIAKNVIPLYQEGTFQLNKYLIDVTPLDINEPGAMLMNCIVGDNFIDFLGYVYRIDNIESTAYGLKLLLYDINERSVSEYINYGPYQDRIGYVYRPTKYGIILSQAQILKLDSQARDRIGNIEKGVIWESLFHIDQTYPQTIFGGVPLFSSGLYTDFIDFNLESEIEFQEGRLSWDNDAGTLKLGLPGGNVTGQLFQEMLEKVKNESGVTIANGKAVYVSGAIGRNIKIGLGDSTDYLKSFIFGVTTEEIANNGFGYICTRGKVGGINTSSWEVNDKLWLTTNGNMSNVPPEAPGIKVFVGVVLIKHATEGVIDIKPTFVPRMSGLSDVYGTPSLDGQVYSWDTTEQRFILRNLIDSYSYYSLLPPTGEAGKIYITTDNNKTYRWSGSGYTEISPSLALGETSATAYRGDCGKIAYDHSQTTGNPHNTTFAQINSKPTTLAGYGITDAYTKNNLQTSGGASVHWNNITNTPSTYTPAEHSHNYAGSITPSGTANSALLIKGTYTSQGGQQPPAYISSGYVRFNMMNTIINGNNSYKDFILMDTYTGSDVPWVTAFGVAKSVVPKAFIMTGPKNGEEWASTAELLSTYNYATYTLSASLKGSANGIAELDGSGKVPSSQLPSYVDDVLEYTTFSLLPSVGESGKIYITTDTNKTYRWSGSIYTEISPSLALGETSATAYRGDRGKTAYEHSQVAGNPHNTTFAQLGSKPTTLAGYGITDAANSGHSHNYITIILSGTLPSTLTDYSSYCTNYNKGVSIIASNSAVGNIGAIDTVVNFGSGSFRFFRLLNNRAGSLRWQTSNSDATDFAAERTLFDNYNYASYCPDLSAIESISGTNGLLRKTATNTWTLDTNDYSLSTHQHSFASITSKPTTLAGYGITDALSLGETSATAYRGDRGKTAYDHSQSTGNPHATSFAQLGSKPTTLEGYGITDATPSSINNGRYITDGVNLTGTYVGGSIRMSTQYGVTGYPSAYGITYSFDAATPSRAFSIFSPKELNNLYFQKYNEAGVGFGWQKIYTSANLDLSNYLTKLYEAYSSLTYSSVITWDCSTGLNKTLTASGNFTINLTNLENGMSGDLRITSSTIITIALPSGSRLNGNVTNLTAGVYHLAWVYNGSVLDFNIALYE